MCQYGVIFQQTNALSSSFSYYTSLYHLPSSFLYLFSSPFLILLWFLIPLKINSTQPLFLLFFFPLYSPPPISRSAPFSIFLFLFLLLFSLLSLLSFFSSFVYYFLFPLYYFSFPLPSIISSSLFIVFLFLFPLLSHLISSSSSCSSTPFHLLMFLLVFLLPLALRQSLSSSTSVLVIPFHLQFPLLPNYFSYSFGCVPVFFQSFSTSTGP